jgi:hypothetical protein
MNQWLDPQRGAQAQARRVKHRRNLGKLSYSHDTVALRRSNKLITLE